MGLLDWFRRRRKKEINEEKKVLDRTGKLQTEVQKRVKREPRKKRRKKKS